MPKSIRVVVVLGGILVMGFAIVRARSLDAQVRTQDSSPESKWEYLIVAQGNVSLNPVGSPGQRKQKDFGQEAVVVERNLDRLGLDGWELVDVGGAPNDPVFYLKRAKR